MRSVPMAHNTVELRCAHASATEAGDGYQVLFETTRDSLEGYVLIQRHFEFPDRGKCYLETADREFCDHYLVRSANLSRNELRVTFGARLAIAGGQKPTAFCSHQFSGASSAEEGALPIRERTPGRESARGVGLGTD